MRYAFFGSPEFAAIVLGRLLDADLLPVAVVCNPDRPSGRKKTLTPPPVKVLAEARGIPAFQPEELSELALPPDLDVMVVAAYAKMIPDGMLKMPRLGTIGVHPSLLPRHRGASPIQSAMLAGDAETGVTLSLLDEKMDHGPVLASRRTDTDSKTFPELREELAALGGELLAETLPAYLENRLKPEPQDQTLATFTKKFIAQDGFVPPADLESALRGGSPDAAFALERKIRALNPEPGVWTSGWSAPELGVAPEKRIKLLNAKIKDGSLVLTRIQAEGKLPRSV